MLLTASPQTMPSLECQVLGHPSIMAKVMDTKGNPVAGELVDSPSSPTNKGSFNQTTAPSIENDTTTTSVPGTVLTGITDPDGIAEITFIPGAFTTNRSNPLYSYNAQGNTTVEAVWGTVDQTIQIQYMNYPFLSVSTFVSPQTLTVNQTVNVSILLQGDGWALQPQPIDVVLYGPVRVDALQRDAGHIGKPGCDQLPVPR